MKSSPFQGSEAVMPEPGTQPMAPVQPMSMEGPQPANAEQLRVLDKLRHQQGRIFR